VPPLSQRCASSLRFPGNEGLGKFSPGKRACGWRERGVSAGGTAYPLPIRLRLGYAGSLARWRYSPPQGGSEKKLTHFRKYAPRSLDGRVKPGHDDEAEIPGRQLWLDLNSARREGKRFTRPRKSVTAQRRVRPGQNRRRHRGVTLAPRRGLRGKSAPSVPGRSGSRGSSRDRGRWRGGDRSR
jgi:hypothetical protein